MIASLILVSCLFVQETQKQQEPPVVTGPLLEALIGNLTEKIEANRAANTRFLERFESRMVERFRLLDRDRDGIFVRIMKRIENLFSLLRLILYTIIIVAIGVVISYFKPVIDVFAQSLAKIIKILFLAIENMLQKIFRIKIES